MELLTRTYRQAQPRPDSQGTRRSNRSALALRACAALGAIIVAVTLAPWGGAAGQAWEVQAQDGGCDQVVLAWREDLGRRLGRNVSVLQGRVAAATVDRRVALLDLESGRRLWCQKRKVGVQAGVRMTGSRVLGIGDLPKGELFCLDAESGRELWSIQLGESWGAPLVREDQVYAAAVSGTVVACSLSTGQRIWERRVAGLVRAPLALVDSLLLVPTVSDTLMALDAATGRPVWRVAPGGALYGPPVEVGGVLWSLSYEGHLWGWDPATGSRLRGICLDGRFRAGLAGSRGMLFALSTGGTLFGIDQENLKTLWRRDLESAANLTPTVGAGLVWVALEDGTLRAFWPSDGRQEVRLTIDVPPVTPVVIAGRHLLIGTGDGELVSFRLWDTAGRSPLKSSHRSAFDRLGRIPLHDMYQLTLATRPGENCGLTPVECLDGLAHIHAEGLASSGGDGLRESLCMQNSDSRSLFRKGRIWTAGWLLGTGMALWLQHEADREYESYQHTGDAVQREQAWDRAARYDRCVLGTWVASEICFLLALRCWMGDD